MKVSNLDKSGFSPEEIAKINEVMIKSGDRSVMEEEKKGGFSGFRRKEKAPSGDLNASLSAMLASSGETEAEVSELKKRVVENEVMLQIMWDYLKEKGITSDDINSKLEAILEARRNSSYKYIYECDVCGKQLQEVKKEIFTFRCIYCGQNKTINRFDRYVIDEAPSKEAEVKEEPHEEKDILNMTFEPYDVSKDLNFEDEDQW